MEPLVLKPRAPVEDEIDCWDEDDFEGDFEIRERGHGDAEDAASEAASVSGSKAPASRSSSGFIAPSKLELPEQTAVPDATNDFEQDLQFPDDGQPLQLSTKKDIPRTPISTHDDFDEWAEGSLGTRHGGTKRDGRSHRSSSLSGLSPSISSSFTAESEDEGLDGLVLPDGPLNLDEALKKRQTTAPSEQPKELHSANKRSSGKDDFFAGIELGDGDVFDSGKQTLNRNIKQKRWQPTDSARPVGLSMGITSKTTSRIPKLTGYPHDRARPTLEPVSEAGPAPSARGARAGIGAHSAQSSASSATGLPVPAGSSAHIPSTTSSSHHPELGTRASLRTLRDQTNNHSSQNLKLKRSLPAIKGQMNSPARPGYPSANRLESSNKSSIPPRPKTPTDRSGADSSLSSRRPPVPHLPLGAAQTHNVSNRPSRGFRRWDSSDSNASVEPAASRSASRLTRTSRSNLRSPSPSRRRDVVPNSLAREAASKRTLTRPMKHRRYGDGSELELFEDLPTSAGLESKYTKVPAGRGAPRTARTKTGPAVPGGHTASVHSISDRAETPMPPPTPRSQGLRPDFTPRFARDTNASRNAREQRIASSGGPLTSLSTNWKSHVAARGAMNSSPRSSRRRHHGEPQKPQLIKPLGDTHANAKSVKGMKYNPTLFRWEGNENALAEFNAPPTTTAAGETTTTPKPALITNLHNASPSIQVVGGMVFDPQAMRWLKLSKHQKNQRKEGRPSIGAASIGSQPSQSLSVHDDDDAKSVDSDDPFANVPDIDDKPTYTRRSGGAGTGAAPAVTPATATGTGTGKQETPHAELGDGAISPALAKSKVALPSNQQQPSTPTLPGPAVPAPPPGTMGSTQDDWLVGEEFDVGPEFIRRQREEEDRWHRKVSKWLGEDGRKVAGHSISAQGREEWRWAIRDLALSSTTDEREKALL